MAIPACSIAGSTGGVCQSIRALRNGDFWRRFYEQVQVIALAVHLDQLRLEAEAVQVGDRHA